MKKIFALCALSILLSSSVKSLAVARQSDTIVKYQLATTKRKSVNKASAYGLLLGALLGGYQGAVLSDHQDKTAAALGLGSIGAGLAWLCSKQLIEDETAIIDGLEHGAFSLGAATVGYMVGLMGGMFGRVCAGHELRQEDHNALHGLNRLLGIASAASRFANDMSQWQ